MVTFTEIDGAFPQYYQILGVPTTATRRDISQAYKPLALSEHPDKKGSTPQANARFANINQARDVLTNPELRGEYDKQLYQAQQEAISAQRRAAEDAQRRAADEQRRAQAVPPRPPGPAFEDGPSVSESAFNHAFSRRGGSATTSWFVENPDAEAQFREFINRQNLPFGKYGTPEVPPGEGAWEGKPSHPVWRQAAEVWSACSSLCNLAATVERLMQDLEAEARRACPKELFTAFIPRMPDDHAQKYHSGIDLLWDILRFSGSGYVALKRSIEEIKLKSPADAIMEMNKFQRQLDQVHVQMLSTERAITNQGVHIVGRTSDATALWKAMEHLCRGWDGLIKLPDVIQNRIEEIFKDGEYVPGWQPQGEFYPIESWKKSRKPKAGKRGGGKAGRKGSKDSKSSSDESTTRN
jgi:DnaJ-domain-containing protein 1